MLGLEHRRAEPVELVELGAHQPRRDLPVEHLRAQVGVVGRELAPSLLAVVGAHPHERDPLGRPAVDLGDAAQNTITFRTAAPERIASIASLMRSSG